MRHPAKHTGRRASLGLVVGLSIGILAGCDDVLSVDLPASLTDEALTTGVGFALLAGFVDDLQVRPVEEGAGTEVRMVWPVHHRR